MDLSINLNGGRKLHRSDKKKNPKEFLKMLFPEHGTTETPFIKTKMG